MNEITDPPRLSVVVPVYNEQESVVPLYQGICTALAGIEGTFELLFVDDASTDGTAESLQSLQFDGRVRHIEFRRNYGQTAAMWAGIQAARGSAIVTIDGDLQNDPADIPKLVARLDEGYDIVIGWRRDRQDPLCSRVLPSKVANWLIGKITGMAVHDCGCSLKAYRSTVIQSVPLYSEMHRFIPALAASAGASISEVVVQHHPRRYGQSKYGLSRLIKVLLDIVTVKMLITCADRPMHWFAALSVPFWMLTAGTVAWSWDQPGGVVIPLLVILFAYLALYLNSVGLLAELFFRSRSR